MAAARAVARAVDDFWDAEVIPSLSDLLRIKYVSYEYDKDALEEAAAHLVTWANSFGVPGMNAEIVKIPGRSANCVT